MCREYKLARLNWCCQLLNSYPVSMLCFIWFADGKLLKFFLCSHKNHLEESLSRTCGDSLTFAADCSFRAATHCTSTQELARWLSF